MNSKAVNTLNYTGIVTLSQYVGNNKVQLAQIHNTGGTSLFNFLASCLAGHFQYASVNWPTKIKLLDYAVDGSEYTYESVSGFIFLRTAPEIISTDTGECRVRYSFTVPRDTLENAVNTITKSLGIGLYTHGASGDELADFAAFCEINSDFSLNTLVNATLLVDWELVIANAGTKIS